MTLETNLYDLLPEMRTPSVTTMVLGKAFEPEEPYENPDGTPIYFDADYLGTSPGPESPARSLCLRGGAEKLSLTTARAALWCGNGFSFARNRKRRQTFPKGRLPPFLWSAAVALAYTRCRFRKSRIHIQRGLAIEHVAAVVRIFHLIEFHRLAHGLNMPVEFQALGEGDRPVLAAVHDEHRRHDGVRR